MRIYLENEGDLELDLNYQEVAQRVGDAVSFSTNRLIIFSSFTKLAIIGAKKRRAMY